jgi:hypothetical protein
MGDTNINNGMITKLWGPPGWKYLHTVTFGYPIEPTDEQKKKYKGFFELVGDTLPCRYCRESYKKFISSGYSELNEDTMKNRDTLTRWLYDVHQKVNDKLGVNYGVSFDDIKKYYEASRAKCTPKNKQKTNKEKGCIMPLNDKANSFQIASKIECPILPLELAKRFICYAKKRNINNKYFKYVNQTQNDIDKTSDEWSNRTKLCRQYIKKIRMRGIESIEKEGKWKGLPTIDELKLILLLSSTMGIDKLLEIYQKLPQDEICKIKMYRLTN